MGILTHWISFEIKSVKPYNGSIFPYFTFALYSYHNICAFLAKDIDFLFNVKKEDGESLREYVYHFGVVLL